MSAALELVWTPPGPVSAACYNAMGDVQAEMGPIGSGKTTLFLMKIIKVARLQKPSPRDGVRRVKACVVHGNYRQLWRATIPSWWKRMPQSVGEWVGSAGGPATHKILFDDGQGRIELIVDFVAIGDNRAEDILRGYEPTLFFLNEADLLASDVLPYCRGRVGRYPDIADGGPSWYGVFMDFNAPNVEDWIYRIFFEDRPPGFEIFVQPSGLSDQAENLDNLPAGYYTNQLAGQPEWYVRRMIRNEFGYSRDGMPVYPEFIDSFHVADHVLEPLPGLPLKIGGDAGRSPAAIIGQRTATGQWRILDEIIATNMGANGFGKVVAQRLKERYGELVRDASRPPWAAEYRSLGRPGGGPSRRGQ